MLMPLRPNAADNDLASITLTVQAHTAEGVTTADSTIQKIGRASCREREKISVAAVSLKKKDNETGAVTVTITPTFESDSDATPNNTLTSASVRAGATLTNTSGDTFSGKKNTPFAVPK